MIEEIKNDIAILEEEISEACDKFNSRLENNPLGLMIYKQSMDNMLCGDYVPSESAHKFYETYSTLFDFAETYKITHPEEGKATINANLERFCVEDETIRRHLTAHLYIATEESIAYFAHVIVGLYNTLSWLDYDEIVNLRKILQVKRERLASLEAEQPDPMLPSFESFDEQLERFGEATKMIEDATRSLVNKGARKLLKLAKYVKEKTDKK